MTSSVVRGWSCSLIERARLHTAAGGAFGPVAGPRSECPGSDANGAAGPSGEPAARPLLDLRERRLEPTTHRGQRVLDPHRRPRQDGALDDAPRLELLHPFGQEP